MTKSINSRLLSHGLASLLLALLGGFMLVFSLIGGISLDPLPAFLR